MSKPANFRVLSLEMDASNAPYNVKGRFECTGNRFDQFAPFDHETDNLRLTNCYITGTWPTDGKDRTEGTFVAGFVWMKVPAPKPSSKPPGLEVLTVGPGLIHKQASDVSCVFTCSEPIDPAEYRVPFDHDTPMFKLEGCVVMDSYASYEDGSHGVPTRCGGHLTARLATRKVPLPVTTGPAVGKSIAPVEIKPSAAQALTLLTADLQLQMTQQVVDCLNSAYKADPTAIRLMVANAVPANQALVDHPHVTVDNRPGFYILTALGLINGALSAAGLLKVCYRFSDTADKEGRHEFLGFEIAPGQGVTYIPTPEAIRDAGRLDTPKMTLDQFYDAAKKRVLETQPPSAEDDSTDEEDDMIELRQMSDAMLAQEQRDLEDELLGINAEHDEVIEELGEINDEVRRRKALAHMCKMIKEGKLAIPPQWDFTEPYKWAPAPPYGYPSCRLGDLFVGPGLRVDVGQAGADTTVLVDITTGAE